MRCLRRCGNPLSLPATAVRGSQHMSTTTWIVLGIIAALVVWIIMIYNGLVAMRQRVNQAFADIDVQLKQRHDLVPNLVETVKGYATHERGTLEAVVAGAQRRSRRARAGRAGAGGEYAERGVAPAVRVVGGLSGPQGQHQFPAAAERALRHREQDRGRAPLLQQFGAGVQHRHPATSRPRCSPVRSASPRRCSSISARRERSSNRRRR